MFAKKSKVYKIRKGLNYSGIWFFKMFFRKQKPFWVEVVLDESCEVKTLGVQKIFGIGDLFHHNNSDRYGFIYKGNSEFQICSYQYSNGELLPQRILRTVKSNEPFKIAFRKGITEKYKIGRYLYPYFEQDGDSEKGAPHTMKIKLTFNNIN